MGLLLVAACSGSPLEGTGVACDPMAYSLDDEVWVLQGGRTIRLNEEGLLGANPAISADGERVAFTSGRTEAGFDLFTVNVDGSNRNLVYAGDLTQSSVD
ncbi:MAG: hypothetical protein WBM90_03145, partial [Acidimicrobiia bacterium]